MFPLKTLVVLVSCSLALASPTQVETAKRATCTVNSVASASNLSSCTSVVITPFTVPSGNVLTITAASGASITMTGSVTFAKTTSAGPLITFNTNNVNFNANGFTFYGNGPEYWDGLGTGGGVAKPHPFVKFKGYGTFSNLIIKDSPAHAISIGTTGGAATFSNILVDNLDGDAGALGHNTDGFDLSASNVTITGSKVYNQDDCLAVNSGSNIVFSNNFCSGGHGISIGSIATDHSVSGVTISGNTVQNSMYGLRIKVDADATDATVSGITYSGNTITGIAKYGVLISQSYPDDFSTPGTSSTISGVTFSGTKTSVAVNSTATRLAVDCGHCSGTWNFGQLAITGGKTSVIDAGGASISGGSY